MCIVIYSIGSFVQPLWILPLILLAQTNKCACRNSLMPVSLRLGAEMHWLCAVVRGRCRWSSAYPSVLNVGSNATRIANIPSMTKTCSG